VLTMAKRVFVTGLSGFTGRYLREVLMADGLEVHGIGQSADEGVRHCDLNDVASLTRIIGEVRPDYVVHLAAIAYVAHDDPLEFYRVNVLGTEALLKAILAANVTPTKVLLASSANIYGNANQLPITEDVPPAPTNHYANSKLAMEMICRNWFGKLPMLIARPFNYTGFGQAENFLVPKIVKHFASGASVIRLGNLDVSRDISDVSYLVEAYRRLLVGDAVSETVNICGGRDYSIAQILGTMKKISSHNIQVEVDPGLVRGAEVVRLYGSPAKLRRLVGDIPAPGLREILTHMYDQYTAQAH